MSVVEWKYRDEIKEKYGFTNRQFYVFFSLAFLCPYEELPTTVLERLAYFGPATYKEEHDIMAKWILDGERND